MTKHPTTLGWAAAAMILITGCENNKTTALDNSSGATTVAVEEKKENPFAFWTWFGSDEKKAEEAQAKPVTAASASAYAPEEKKESKNPLAFWTWFSGDEKKAEEPGPIAYSEPEEKKNPLGFLAFWTWFGGDDKPKQITEEDVLKDMSPELKSLAETPGEIRLREARVRNTNSRTLQDDLADVLMLERPSRLSKYSVP